MATNPSSGKEDRLSPPSMESVRDATNAIDGGHPLEPKAAPAPAKQIDPVFEAYDKAKAKEEAGKGKSEGEKGDAGKMHAAIKAHAPGMHNRPQTKEASNLNKAMANERVKDVKAQTLSTQNKAFVEKNKNSMVNSKEMQSKSIASPDKEVDKTR